MLACSAGDPPGAGIRPEAELRQWCAKGDAKLLRYRFMRSRVGISVHIPERLACIEEMTSREWYVDAEREDARGVL